MGTQAGAMKFTESVRKDDSACKYASMFGYSLRMAGNHDVPWRGDP